MDLNLRYLLDSLRERLWVKPTLYASLAVATLLAARLADTPRLARFVPDINAQTIEALVTIISASMLGVATFAVASMVSAYAAASGSTTPRAFSLLVKDRGSQNALSSFIGAFIFSVAGIIAVKVEYYGDAGRFILFLLAIGVMIWVVATFVRWVDGIARLGRLGNTVDRLEEALMGALAAWGPGRALGCEPCAPNEPPAGVPLFAATVGYVRHVDVHALQAFAEEHDARIRLGVPPGAFVTLDRPLLYLQGKDGPIDDEHRERLQDSFVLADTRTFTQDPRLGLISLSEIASRALSPAVNDPGTAIECLSRLVKTLSLWKLDTLDGTDEDPSQHDRVRVARLSIDDMFEDAFAAIARDAAPCVEVGVRLQKALAALDALGHEEMQGAARAQARWALERAEAAMSFEPDIKRVRAAATLVN